MPSLVRFFTLSPDLLVAVSLRDGLIRRVNPAACCAFGWSEAELLSRPYMELTHPDDHDALRAAAAALVAGQTTLRVEARTLGKDGSYFWTEWHAAYFADEDLLYGIGRDMSERRKTEAALAAVQAERNAVLESIGDAFLGIDAEWRVTYANARAAELIGETPETMLGRRLEDLFSREVWAERSPQLDRVRQSMADRQQRDLEFFRGYDGRWISARLYPRDDGGLSVYFQDVSERKRMEEELRASQAHFEAVANLVPDLLWRSEPDGTVTWFNDGWSIYHGLPVEALGGSGWGVLHPDDIEASRASLEAGFRSKQPVSMVNRIRRNDGVYRWFLVRMQPEFDGDGEVSAWFGAATDIDDLKRSQGQQQLLIAELQHRTRNLLGIVHSVAAQTMRGSTSLDDFSERFNNRLGALSRVQSFLSQSSAIGIGDVLHAELAAHGIDSNDPRIILEGPSAALPTGCVQPLALGLHELTTNALKHGAFATPSGHLAVRWSIDTETESPSLRLEWRESGVLMPDHDRPMRRGFGLNLIERGLPYQLGTSTRMAFSPGGLVCDLVLPLPSVKLVAPAPVG